MRIFLVEDEEQIRKMMKFNLEAEGYEVVTASDGKEALGIIDGQHFDLIILDIVLPGLNRYQISENRRLRNEKVGILMVSAKDSSQD